MKKIYELLKENKWIHYLIILTVGIILSIPLKDVEIRDTHDGFIHLLRLLGTFDTLSIGQIPAMIIPDFCSAMGYSMTLFYPPLVTYIPLLFKFIMPTYAMALKLFGAVCIILSGFTMYHFTYQLTKKRSIALFSSIIYLIAPYKLGNIYKRYAIGEFVALIFLPTLFQGMHSLFNEDGKKHYLIAIGATLLILSHTITTIYAAIFCAIYIMFYLPKLKEKKVLKKIFINFIFILLMSSLFTLPMIEAKQATNYCIFTDSIMRTTPSFTHSNSLELFEFFWDVGEENATTYIIGIPVLVLLLLSFYTIKKVDDKYKDLFIIFTTFSVLALYITTKYFPWRIMPSLLCKLQYPWRLVGFFNFFSSLVCGINLYIIINKFVKKDWLKVVTLLVVLALCIGYTMPILNAFKSTDMQKDENYEEFILKNPQIDHMKVNRDYLPVRAIFVQDTYMQTKQNKTDVLEGSAKISNEEKVNLSMSMDIENAKKDTILEFPFIYYPGYKATIKIDDTIKEIKTIESRYGYVAIKLPEDIEKGKLEVAFEVTNITKIGHIISFISVIIFGIYVFVEKRRGVEKCIKAE